MNIFEKIVFEEVPTKLEAYSKLTSALSGTGLIVRTDEINGKIIATVSAPKNHQINIHTSTYGNGAYFHITNNVTLIALPSRCAGPAPRDQRPKATDDRTFLSRKNMLIIDKRAKTPAHVGSYPLVDGTLVNIYWFDGHWNVGSKSASNIEDYEWRGIRFKEEFKRIARQYPAFSITNLRKNLTYSFLMTSKSMHPTDTIDAIHLMSVQDPKTLKYFYDIDVGVDVMKKSTKRSKFGMMHRNEDGFDTISKTKYYTALRRMLYNIPNVPRHLVRDFNIAFRETDFMILCNIACNLDEFTKKVPTLVDRTNVIKTNLTVITDNIAKDQSGLSETLAKAIGDLDKTSNDYHDAIFAIMMDLNYLLETYAILKDHLSRSAM